MEINNSSVNASAFSSVQSGVSQSRGASVKGANSTFGSDVASDSLRKLDPENKNTNRNTDISTQTSNIDSITLDEQSKKSQSNQSKQSFVLDDSKLAIIESHQAKSQSSSTQVLEANSLQFNEQANAFSQTNQQDYKEQIPSRNQTAVSTYANIDNLAQRESVQKLFGVDLFA
jgi:hypothetical protein